MYVCSGCIFTVMSAETKFSKLQSTTQCMCIVTIHCVLLVTTLVLSFAFYVSSPGELWPRNVTNSIVTLAKRCVVVFCSTQCHDELMQCLATIPCDNCLACFTKACTLSELGC